VKPPNGAATDPAGAIPLDDVKTTEEIAMQKKQPRKLHLPKETLLHLTGREMGEAAGGATTATCYCTKVCTITCTAKVGECCA